MGKRSGLFSETLKFMDFAVKSSAAPSSERRTSIASGPGNGSGRAIVVGAGTLDRDEIDHIDVRRSSGTCSDACFTKLIQPKIKPDASALDGFAFDPFSSQQDGLTAPEVDVGWCQIVDDAEDRIQYASCLKISDDGQVEMGTDVEAAYRANWVRGLDARPACTAVTIRIVAPLAMPIRC